MDKIEDILSNEEMLSIMLHNDVLFCAGRKYYCDMTKKMCPETIVLFLNCNDTFVWGCADAEEIAYDELPELYKMYKSCPCGTDKWVCIKRNQKPQKPVEDLMKENGSWDEIMEKLPENEYEKYLKEEHSEKKIK